jgi:hypothetical protein
MIWRFFREIEPISGHFFGTYRACRPDRLGAPTFGLASKLVFQKRSVSSWTLPCLT